MILHRLVALAVLSAGIAVAPATAASFDCAKASTPFEHAICDMPDLSAADEVLAKAFATATGGLTKEASGVMRVDQRAWLDFAQRSCTDDAEPLASGRYDEEGGACLLQAFAQRSKALELSRMLGGHRFYLKSFYAALPDPTEAANPDSYWKVATHELVLPLLDNDDPLAGFFNDYVMDSAINQTDIASLANGGDVDELDTSANASVILSVEEVVQTARITLAVNTYWFGHGAAHGNWGIRYLHYYVPDGRGLLASDVFSGEDWATVLVEAAWEQLQVEHKERLQVESAGDIAEVVVEPSRWDLSDPYGLVIQFQPYEVSAYAYGAPTITIPWEKLESIKAENQNFARYGF
jgi:uncharacterized protein YecT (DUF1311 family)